MTQENMHTGDSAPETGVPGQGSPSTPSYSSSGGRTATPAGSGGGSGMTQLQGYILISISVLILFMVGFNSFGPGSKYEYSILKVEAKASGADKTGTAMDDKSVDLENYKLKALGEQGWELVESFLEIETAHPNFGNSEYVTGLQPNVRPKKVVLIFRRKL